MQPEANNQPTEIPATPPVVSDAPVTQPVLPPSEPPKSRKKLRLAAIIIAGIILICGAGAAAYFGVVVPNQPENVLKQAIENTSTQTKSKFNGNLNFESLEQEGGFAAQIGISGQSNSENKSFESKFDVTVSGVKVPVEVRYLDKTAYARVGDLSTLKALATGYSPEYGPVVDELSKKLSNQWIEFDQTLMKQAKVDCALDASLAFTKEDMKLLQDRFKAVPFAAITSTSDEQVNGKSAIKYEIEIDDNKGAEYVKGLDQLSFVKKLKECDGGDEAFKDSTKDLADNDKTPLTLWVDKKSKTIVRVASHSTKQDEEKEKIKGALELNFEYGSADVTKPEGTKPAMQLFGELGPLFGGLLGGVSVPAAATDTPLSTEYAQCTEAFQAFAASGGTATLPANCQALLSQ